MNRSKLKVIFLLHLLLVVYSLSGILSKKAGGEAFLSPRFCLFYGGVILLLALYALCWQQIIKRLPLTTAFANKAVTVVWGIIWGALFFRESVTPGKVIGAAVVVVGVVLFALSEGKDEAAGDTAKDAVEAAAEEGEGAPE